MNTTLKCNTVVVKIASRCNLNCTYCYMYNMGDETYKLQPKKMSMDTIQNLMHQILNHCQNHSLKKYSIVLHGGEPLLAGRQFFYDFVYSLKRTIPSKIEVKIVVQTNGLLLDDAWCETLSELGIGIGISLDGTQEANDKYRIDHSGKGSYLRIIKGLETAQKSKFLKNKPGVLSVIDVYSDPTDIYNHFKILGIESVDFLLPEATYEVYPPGKVDFLNTNYGEWLITLFDEWFFDTSKNRIKQIRFFDQIIHMLLGGVVSSDLIGELNNQVLVIETDGGIEAVDALKVCGDGFTKSGANVSSHTFDEAIDTDLASLYHLSHQILCGRCSVCPIKEICGGGYLPHRFSKQNGFNNPSIYCNDLLIIIAHIQNQLLKSIPQHLHADLGVELIQQEEILDYLNSSFPQNDKDVAKRLESFKQYKS